MPTQISKLSSDTELTAAFPVFLTLRPHLDLERFIAQVRRQQAQGYQIVAVSGGDEVLAVAGFRLAEFLAWGKVLYVDDLSTLPAHRGCGYAGALLEWLLQEARAQGCDAIHLDSGYGRHDAHRLYLNQGFNLVSHHFSRTLG